MGGLKYFIIISFLLKLPAHSRVEVSAELNWYRQIGLNLTDSFVVVGKPIPDDIRDWPIMKQEVLKSGESGLYFMKTTNRLAFVPKFPVISCFDKTYARKHNGSRVLAVSRTPVTQENQMGRYVILQTSDPESVWATWLEEEDAQILFKSLGDFDPSIQPMPFPEVGDRENSERLADEREKKAIQQIVKEEDFRENSRKPTSGEKEGKTKLNSSDGDETARSKFNSSIWIIGSVFFGVLIVGIWRLTRKPTSS